MASLQGEFVDNDINGVGVYQWVLPPKLHKLLRWVQVMACCQGDGRKFEGQWVKNRMHGLVPIVIAEFPRVGSCGRRGLVKVTGTSPGWMAGLMRESTRTIKKMVRERPDLSLTLRLKKSLAMPIGFCACLAPQV